MKIFEKSFLLLLVLSQLSLNEGYMYGIATSMSGQVIKFDHGYDPHFQQQQRQFLLFVYNDKK